jgi:hypothetical protein
MLTGRKYVVSCFYECDSSTTHAHHYPGRAGTVGGDDEGDRLPTWSTIGTSARSPNFLRATLAAYLLLVLLTFAAKFVRFLWGLAARVISKWAALASAISTYAVESNSREERARLRTAIMPTEEGKEMS